ncbi:SOS response-associated peptidase, partial [Salmonella enterica]
VDIHDPLPLVLPPDAARERMPPGISGQQTEEIITDGALPTHKFTCHAVKRAVGNVQNQREALLKPVT